MELIADILLAAGALGAGLYCFVLGRRLNRFNDLEKGVGGAVAVLSAQVDDLSRTLAAAQATAKRAEQNLAELTSRAEEMSRRLELQIASLHDIPQQPPQNPPQPELKTKTARTPDAAAPPKPSEPMFVRHRTTGDAA